MGSPIRTSAGQSDICSSPQLFAACHVLRRLPVPRHPPYALSYLTFAIYALYMVFLLLFSVEALFQIFDLVKSLMHPNSKISDFVNLTAEIVDTLGLPVLFVSPDFSRLCSFLLFSFQGTLELSPSACASGSSLVENKGLCVPASQSRRPSAPFSVASDRSLKNHAPHNFSSRSHPFGFEP